MAQLSISAAARAAGKDRGTIQRYIKSGKLSASRDASGNTVVETSELLRVFGSLKGGGDRSPAESVAAQTAVSGSMQHVLESTLDLLKQQLRASQEREERLLAMLEQEQQSRRELEQRLLPPPAVAREGEQSIVESATVIVPAASILTEADNAGGKNGPERKGFFAKFFT